MIECDRCQALMSADGLTRAIANDDTFECAGCGDKFSRRSPVLVVYRMSEAALAQLNAEAAPSQASTLDASQATSADEPLSVRAQEVLIAMLDLDAIDSDRRQSTETIAVRASGGDANSLKTVMSDLNTRQLIASKTGRTGGCWLTARGIARAGKLRDAAGNSATV